MKKLGLLLVMLTFAAVCWGDVVMTFNSTGPFSYLGKSAYPYNFTVNGQAEQLMCITDNRQITGGETWEAILGPIPLPAPLLWLYLQDKATGGIHEDIQGAIWHMLDPTEPLTLMAAYWTNLADSQTFTVGEFKNIEVFSPDPANQTGWTKGEPQVFVGSTPEPASLLLTGSGLVVCAFMQRHVRKALAALKA